MKTALVALVGGIVLLLAPRCVRAQACCGAPVSFEASCPYDCDYIYVYQCDAGGGHTWMPVGLIQCGNNPYCGSVQTYVPSGYCYDGATNALSSVSGDPANASAEDTAYVNAYIRDCRGEYVAVRIPMESRAT